MSQSQAVLAIEIFGWPTCNRGNGLVHRVLKHRDGRMCIDCGLEVLPWYCRRCEDIPVPSVRSNVFDAYAMLWVCEECLR